MNQVEQFLDTIPPLYVACATAAVLLVAGAFVYHKQLRFIVKSLNRNKLRTGLTGVATAVLVFIVTLIWSILWFLDLVTTEKAKDFKAIVTERWQLPSQMPISYANTLAEGAAARPGDIVPQDHMTWQFFGGTIDPIKRTRENIVFFFCMEPSKLLTMMDGIDEFSETDLEKLKWAISEMEKDKRKVLTAWREVQTNEAAVELAVRGLQAAEKLEKAGAGTRPDVLRAEVQRDQARARLDVSRRRFEAAGRLLAAAVGVPHLPGGPLEGTLLTAVPAYDWPALLATVLTRSSEVQEAQALVGEAERNLHLAIAQRTPNVTVQVRPLYSFPDQSFEPMIQVGAPIPIFNRNQGNILAARADVARTEEQVRQVELRLTERLAGAYQRYQAAREQREAYEKRILPRARESLRLVTIGYERGDPKYDFTAVLQAQTTLVQSQLAYVQVLGEVWRAVSEIKGLIQDEPPPVGQSSPACPP